jgi:hypothetical protein
MGLIWGMGKRKWKLERKPHVLVDTQFERQKNPVMTASWMKCKKIRYTSTFSCIKWRYFLCFYNLCWQAAHDLNYRNYYVRNKIVFIYFDACQNQLPPCRNVDRKARVRTSFLPVETSTEKRVLRKKAALSFQRRLSQKDSTSKHRSENMFTTCDIVGFRHG